MNKQSLKKLKKIKFITLAELKNKKFVKNFDLCFVGTNHDIFNYNFIANNIKIIFDSRHSFKKK